MAYETRRDRVYYYLKQRQDGRVRSIYVPAGPAADAISEAARQRREQRRLWHKALLLDRKRFIRQATLGLEELLLLQRASRCFFTAHLISLGFKYHRGEWRSPVRGRPRLTLRKEQDTGYNTMAKRKGRLARQDQKTDRGENAASQTHDEMEALQENVRMAEAVLEQVNAAAPTAADREALRRVLPSEGGPWAEPNRLKARTIEMMLQRVAMESARRSDLRMMVEEDLLDLGYHAAAAEERLLIEAVAFGRLDLELLRIQREQVLCAAPDRIKTQMIEQFYSAAHKRYVDTNESLVRHRKLVGRRPNQSSLR